MTNSKHGENRHLSYILIAELAVMMLMDADGMHYSSGDPRRYPLLYRPSHLYIVDLSMDWTFTLSYI